MKHTPILLVLSVLISCKEKTEDFDLGKGYSESDTASYPHDVPEQRTQYEVIIGNDTLSKTNNDTPVEE